MIKQKEEKSTIEVDLTGPQGNAFFLLGMANDLAKQLGFNSKEICDEMRVQVHDSFPMTHKAWTKWTEVIPGPARPGTAAQRLRIRSASAAATGPRPGTARPGAGAAAAG